MADAARAVVVLSAITVAVAAGSLLFSLAWRGLWAEACADTTSQRASRVPREMTRHGVRRASGLSDAAPNVRASLTES